MNNIDKEFTYEIIHVIINKGMGSKILQTSKELGISGGTIFLGRGTVNNSILKFLSLQSEEKEVVVMGTNSPKARVVLNELNKKFKFNKANHGIVFTTISTNILASSCFKSEEKLEGDVKEQMYQLVTVVVNRGKAEDVVEAATAAGAKGGTIVNGRGSGIHETSKLFNMDIEPEKEIVMLIIKKEITENVVSSIRNIVDIDKPGNGIIFIQEVSSTYGIYE